MYDLPVSGRAQNFIDGLTILKPYVGGTTNLIFKGLTIHVVNVNWDNITESQQFTLIKKGWVKHYISGYPMWVAEG